jgi:acyl-CoA synthetase (AMP-forming)/AMP-acid ligase II
MDKAASTLVDCLQRHAATRPQARAFVFLDNGEREAGSRSFGELDSRARVIASWLVRNGCAGRHVLLLLRDGLDFIDALMGCLYAGAVPVPVAVPRPNRPVQALVAIAADADVAAVLTRGAEETYLRPGMQDLTWLRLEDAEGDPAEWPGRRIAPEALALLQYTSGSTGTPKGVMLTHANLMHNQAAIRHSMRLSEASLFVGWLPLFHDMGLIGNVMQSIYLGIGCVLMPPVAFLQRPLRWLTAISHYKATISGAPNFAYDLAVDKTTPESRAGLDLSAWQVAFNGSEPVRAATLERFAAAFASAGFRRTSFYPCYGLAESTLFVTGGWLGDTLTCGRAAPGMEVAIVDPSSGERRPDGVEGEIWIRGPSVAAGYHNRETFGPFLRTGDLGSMREGELSITGRLKDVIIIRGRNHYPTDLEATAERANPLLAKGAGAALSLDDGRQTAIAIVQELTREGWQRADREAVAADIRQAIAACHELQVRHVLLIKPGSLPRTTSGKVRRSACRALVQAEVA